MKRGTFRNFLYRKLHSLQSPPGVIKVSFYFGSIHIGFAVTGGWEGVELKIEDAFVGRRLSSWRPSTLKFLKHTLIPKVNLILWKITFRFTSIRFYNTINWLIWTIVIQQLSTIVEKLIWINEKILKPTFSRGARLFEGSSYSIIILCLGLSLIQGDAPLR